MTAYFLVPEPPVAEWLRTRVSARCVTDPPKAAQFKAALPLVWVKRIPGTSRMFTKDRPVLDIDCYAADYDAARALAYDCFGRLLNELPGTAVAGGWVSGVNEILAPVEFPHPGEWARRFGCTVQLITHL